MTELDVVMNNASWLKQSSIEESERNEFQELVNGRSMLYAPVEQPKSFAADMKHSTGRLMDFNKGMVHTILPSLHFYDRNNNTWFRL